ncbi:MAG: transposase [Armatimonadetes bacterium]|nr:transposase [Armatimonadota bacterium]
MEEKRRLIEFGELEGDRRSTGNSPNSSHQNHGAVPETEVSTKHRRRRFSTEYKLTILKEIDTSIKPGGIGAILRREGLYYSNITKWREQLELGKLRKKLSSKHQKKITELSKQNRKLQRDLNRSKLIIEAQKKILQILELEDQS